MTISRQQQGTPAGITNLNACINVILGSSTDTTLNSIQYIGTVAPSAVATVTFSSPPAFSFFLVQFTAKTSSASSDWVTWKLNGSATGYNYSLAGNVNGAFSNGLTASATSANFGLASGSQSAGFFSEGFALIAANGNSSAFPCFSTLSSEYSATTDLYQAVTGGQWLTSGSITSIVFALGTGGNFVNGSRFTLFGLN